MRLKRVKLAGFKSFVDPTSIPFPDDMTAVVGPNGCGKSNVIDAVRWVLGESSAKNLRGDAMTDVIFNGSSARKPVSQCSVELVFDNSSGRIQGEYAAYDELSVKRLVTRDGQSNYFLNASKCRKRDVTDLFLGTGLGPRSYAIIEQGTISRLIESKPQELRIFIEEAAGVSKYKERRRETENRMRHTRDNLERLKDVRGELGQQLEKLQRQAQAAKRFKVLKAKERQLKGELVAIRWLKFSQQVSTLQQKMAQQETDLEAIISQQRGDETDITRYQQQQEDLKQQLSDIQQQHFRMSTEITRIEQNQVHAEQRNKQIVAELQGLQDTLNDSEQKQSQHQSAQTELEEQLEVLLPEQEISEASLLQQQEELEGAQQALNSHEQQWRQDTQGFNKLKQKLQEQHGKIQSTLDMQMRTTQRLSEVEQELTELKQSESHQQIEQKQAELTTQQARFHASQLEWQTAEQALLACRQALAAQEQQNNQHLSELQQTQAQLTALNSLQQAQSDSGNLDWLVESNKDAQPLWQYLQCESGWEKALEAALRSWSKAQVLNHTQHADLEDDNQGLLCFADAFTQMKTPGTLAEKLLPSSIPAWCNNLVLVASRRDALAKLPTLKPYQWVLTQQGECFAQDWQWIAKNSQQGVVQRAQQIKQLEQQQVEQQAVYQDAIQTLQQLKQQLEQLEQASRDKHRLSLEAQQQQAALENALQLEKAQQQQHQQRMQKLRAEWDKHQVMQQQEQQQLDEYAEQVEELEWQLQTQQEQQLEQEQQTETLQQQVQNARTNMDSLQRKAHELALQIQGLQGRLTNMRQLFEKDQQQLVDMHNRQAALQQEQQQLAMPVDEQTEQLEVLLNQRTENDHKRQQVADQLAEVENILSDTKRGQQGIEEKIQKKRNELEASRLEYEGARVRASTIVEQLQESGQKLNDILETVPEEADEGQWQAELDKTSGSISRLGAVNLAAVEEYEIQSERKQHLDDQHADLIEALNTLESAIRKIDKETRARFKATFDQVNDDLKQLFPKVFGGGAAYLNLTDDDLLETGVTIMARPPGKKNSTIHLLSGGEKALTALSLVFAIFRLNPAPFCLLDEVDAPLDDANVMRFCKLVSEMSKSVQFIYITHNKIAMEMATHLTGVTMAEPGVSRMVAVDVEEALAFSQG